LFLAIAVVANSFGNLLLALGMGRMPDFAAVALHQYLLGLVENAALLAGATLTAVFTLAQVSLFSWADLSYVIPCIASSYILSTLLGEFVLGEPVRFIRWLGVALICFGVYLVATTPVATKVHTAEAQPR
jgi:drug/metabolite transporter (DMT)-like permease